MSDNSTLPAEADMTPAAVLAVFEQFEYSSSDEWLVKRAPTSDEFDAALKAARILLNR